MSGLDDLIGGLTKKSGSGGGAGGIEDLLGGLLGGGGGATGGSSDGGGGIEDLLGGLLGGRSSGSGGGGMGAQPGGMNMGALVGALAPLIIGMLKNGGLQKMVEGFKQKGMGEQADSWVSAEGNAPVSGSDMKVGLGEDEVRHFAQEAGIPEDQAADVLAAVVPQVVDKLTPGGHVPDDDELEALLRQLQTA